MSKRLSEDTKLYQVWATGNFVLNGSDPASNYHPGFEMVGEYDDLDKAVKEWQRQFYKDTHPIITKKVTWKSEHTEVKD